MLDVPQEAAWLLDRLSIGFDPRTFQRFAALLIGAVLVQGPRTVTACWWAVAGLVPGHFSSFNRVFSRAAWSLWPLARVLTAAALELIPLSHAVTIILDDTVTRHKGPKVYGRGCHRDPVRSTRGLKVFCWGHCWIVLAVLVRLPYTTRPWALPVLVVRWPTLKEDRKAQRPHKTAVDLAASMIAVLHHWFPRRRFIVVADSRYASRALAQRCLECHAVLVSVLPPDAALYAPPPARGKRRGRPPVKGAVLPKPHDAAAKARLRRVTVNWYGGTTRRVHVFQSRGRWYRPGDAMVDLNWVYIKDDLEGDGREFYLFCTDPTATPEQIVGWYTGRWPLEVTFQEVRRHLGLETPRQWARASVERMTPCLLGLFTVVALIYRAYLRGVGRAGLKVGARPWYPKRAPTFADALTTVRGLFWTRTILTPTRARRGARHIGTESLRAILGWTAHAA